jgi:hypothetical protein
MNEELQEQLHKAGLEKAGLEAKKLRLEIRQLRLFFLHPGFIAPLAAIVLAWAGYRSGFFDNKKTLLENQRALLQLDIEKQARRKDSLNKTVADYEKKITDLTIRLRTTTDSLKARLSRLTAKYNSEKQQLLADLAEADRLTSEGKTQAANQKLHEIIRTLNGITGRSFSNDFSDEFQ